MTILRGHYFLSAIDGAAVDRGVAEIIIQTLKDGRHYAIHVTAANTLNGRVSVRNGKMRGTLSSTLMMGPSQQMVFEDMMIKGFEEGFIAERKGDILTLSYSKHRIDFVAE